MWKPIKGYEGLYEIKMDGSVRSLDRTVKGKAKGTQFKKGRVLKHQYSRPGYPTVHLVKNGKYKNNYIHRLVAQNYIPNPEKLPQINHKDGDKTNCHVSNLEWVTLSENRIHAYETGLQKGVESEFARHTKLRRAEVGEIKDLLSYTKLFQREIADFYNISQTQVSRIKRQVNWKNKTKGAN